MFFLIIMKNSQIKYCIETEFHNIIVFSCGQNIFKKTAASCEGEYK